ncbi:hypothetical protein [Allorhodopirellula solitaria]|uniref:Phosphonoacetaldehyde hydrolase n=1 Tax=Allorhodopirellula solitaria TaxID=2527987 RepID=A0A5C5YHH6_9BACT|nr:hypothetical protein [Allorhodopirellula solitaria]TWT74155.1 hypothetical protein CA85_10420 [Allorhodopirellula solitaria]
MTRLVVFDMAGTTVDENGVKVGDWRIDIEEGQKGHCGMTFGIASVAQAGPNCSGHAPLR